MMNKIIILVSILLATLSSQAEFISHCTIYSENGEKFTVYFNGEKKNEEPSEHVRIINLTQSYYSLKIKFEDATIPDIVSNVFNIHDANGNPVDATFIISKNKKGIIGIHWKSQTVFPGYIETNKPTVVIINSGNQVVQQTTTTTTSEPNGVNMDFGLPGGSMHIKTGSNDNTSSTKQTTTTVISNPVIASTSASSPCSGTILGDDDFSGATKSILARSTVEGKILSAKQIIGNNCLSVLQVKTIVKLFEGDETRLDIAKYAYNTTIDKGNYYKLNEVFTNEASIDELNKALIK